MPRGQTKVTVKQLTGGSYDASFGDVMTVAEFKEACETGMFIDYDGHGYAGKFDGDELIVNGDVTIKPSWLERIPKNATHIVWFNK